MEIRKVFFGIYLKIQKLMAPALRYSQSLYEDVLKFHVNTTTKWIDLGCGHQILPPWRLEEEKALVEECKLVVGIDYDLQSLRKHRSIFLRVRGDIDQFPFKDNSFDLATANMVVEHLARPVGLFREVSRILKPGSIFILHTPNALGYATILGNLVPKKLKKKLIYLLDGRKEEDVFGTYYRSNTKNKIHRLASSAGFEVVRTKMIVSSAQLAIIPPLVILELILIRILMMNPFKVFRTNIIAVLRKNREG